MKQQKHILQNQHVFISQINPTFFFRFFFVHNLIFRQQFERRNGGNGAGPTQEDASIFGGVRFENVGTPLAVSGRGLPGTFRNIVGHHRFRGTHEVCLIF